MQRNLPTFLSAIWRSLRSLSCSSTALILSASATSTQYFSRLCSKYDITSFTPGPLKQSVSVLRFSKSRCLFIKSTTAVMASGLASHPMIDRSGKLWKVKQMVISVLLPFFLTRRFVLLRSILCLTAKDEKYKNYWRKWYVAGSPSLPSNKLKFWAYSWLGTSFFPRVSHLCIRCMFWQSFHA